jgi:hypothetical protein
LDRALRQRDIVVLSTVLTLFIPGGITFYCTVYSTSYIGWSSIRSGFRSERLKAFSDHLADDDIHYGVLRCSVDVLPRVLRISFQMITKESIIVVESAAEVPGAFR